MATDTAVADRPGTASGDEAQSQTAPESANPPEPETEAKGSPETGKNRFEGLTPEEIEGELQKEIKATEAKVRESERRKYESDREKAQSKAEDEAQAAFYERNQSEAMRILGGQAYQQTAQLIDAVARAVADGKEWGKDIGIPQREIFQIAEDMKSSAWTAMHAANVEAWRKFLKDDGLRLSSDAEAAIERANRSMRPAAMSKAWFDGFLEVAREKVRGEVRDELEREYADKEKEKEEEAKDESRSKAPSSPNVKGASAAPMTAASLKTLTTEQMAKLLEDPKMEQRIRKLVSS